MTSAATNGVGRFFGVLVTFRRPHELSVMFDRLAGQDVSLAALVVVDNAPSAETQTIVEQYVGRSPGRVDYLPMPENAGPGGGIAAGMDRVLEVAREDDWILLLDDDDPPDTPGLVGEVCRFASEMLFADPTTGGVGVAGARFDRRRGRVIRVPTSELSGAVRVDHVPGNQFPCYRVPAVRAVGVFDPQLFFGFEELEFGLRLRRAGYSMYAHGDVWARRRAAAGRNDFVIRPTWRVQAPNWRDYYGLRNTIRIVHEHGSRRAAASVAFRVGIAKPIVNLGRSPRASAAALRLGVRAIRDAAAGRMGRTLEPDGGPRPDRGAGRGRRSERPVRKTSRPLERRS